MCTACKTKIKSETAVARALIILDFIVFSFRFSAILLTYLWNEQNSVLTMNIKTIAQILSDPRSAGLSLFYPTLSTDGMQAYITSILLPVFADRIPNQLSPLNHVLHLPVSGYCYQWSSLQLILLFFNISIIHKFTNLSYASLLLVTSLATGTIKSL